MRPLLVALIALLQLGLSSARSLSLRGVAGLAGLGIGLHAPLPSAASMPMQLDMSASRVAIDTATRVAIDGPVAAKAERSEIVPSRPTVISLPEERPSDNQIETVLNLIPSWKYFKIIAKEYSSRSTSYREGQENLMAPFM